MAHGEVCCQALSNLHSQHLSPGKNDYDLEKCETHQNDPENILNHELLVRSTRQLFLQVSEQQDIIHAPVFHLPPIPHCWIVNPRSQLKIKNEKGEVVSPLLSFPSSPSLLIDLKDNTTAFLDGLSLFPSRRLLSDSPSLPALAFWFSVQYHSGFGVPVPLDPLVSSSLVMGNTQHTEMLNSQHTFLHMAYIMKSPVFISILKGFNSSSRTQSSSKKVRNNRNSM